MNKTQSLEQFGKNHAEMLSEISDLKCYNDFAKLLKKYGLTFTDLYKYGCSTRAQVDGVKKFFKGKQKLRKPWNEYKKTGIYYYYLTNMGAHIAHSNKHRPK